MDIPDVVKAIQSRDEALTIVIGNQRVAWEKQLTRISSLIP